MPEVNTSPNNAVRRPLQRVAYCRGCDTMMDPETEIISLYSYRNQGMSIFLCLECAQEIGELAK